MTQGGVSDAEAAAYGRAETQGVYLSLGSNLGDRAGNLRTAVEKLGRAVRVSALSSVYETDPVGVTDQPAFYNLALAGRTQLAPRDLLAFVKKVEREVGRRPTFRWGPRVIDIDILLHGDSMIRRKDLVIPHPRMEDRAFVLVPLAEIAPTVRHPVVKLTVQELADRVAGRETVRRTGDYTSP